MFVVRKVKNSMRSRRFSVSIMFEVDLQRFNPDIFRVELLKISLQRSASWFHVRFWAIVDGVNNMHMRRHFFPCSKALK